jgi:hypothetical protein
MRRFGKEFAREVFKVIPQADFIVLDNVCSYHSCYWGTEAFAPDMNRPEDVVEFISTHETYLGQVSCPKNLNPSGYIIWRKDADL